MFLTFNFLTVYLLQKEISPHFGPATTLTKQAIEHISMPKKLSLGALLLHTLNLTTAQLVFGLKEL